MTDLDKEAMKKMLKLLPISVVKMIGAQIIKKYTVEEAFNNLKVATENYSTHPTEENRKTLTTHCEVFVQKYVSDETEKIRLQQKQATQN